jgi:hypothetical protein
MLDGGAGQARRLEVVLRSVELRHVLPRQTARPRGASTGKITSMKIALLILLGLVLGVLGGAALGVGAGLAWIEIFKTSSFEGYSGMLVFFTFMPLGALIGGLGGALPFGVIAIRDAEIAIEKDPSRRHDG